MNVSFKSLDELGFNAETKNYIADLVKTLNESEQAKDATKTGGRVVTLYGSITNPEIRQPFEQLHALCDKLSGNSGFTEYTSPKNGKTYLRNQESRVGFYLGDKQVYTKDVAIYQDGRLIKYQTLKIEDKTAAVDINALANMIAMDAEVSQPQPTQSIPDPVETI